MSFSISKLSSEVWGNSFSEYAHTAVFNEIKPSHWDRIDYALLVLSDSIPVAYMTCREFSHDTVYWQYGGVFNPIKDTIYSFKAYKALMEWHKNHYKRVVTYIENTNKVMLKMAAKVGFIITGIRNYHGSVLLEHLLEF